MVAPGRVRYGKFHCTRKIADGSLLFLTLFMWVHRTCMCGLNHFVVEIHVEGILKCRQASYHNGQIRVTTLYQFGSLLTTSETRHSLIAVCIGPMAGQWCAIGNMHAYMYNYAYRISLNSSHGYYYYMSFQSVLTCEDNSRVGTKQGWVQLTLQHFCSRIHTALLSDLARINVKSALVRHKLT